MKTRLLNLLTFNHIDDKRTKKKNISINPAQITHITVAERAYGMGTGTFRPTCIWLIGQTDPIEVAQSREFIHYKLGCYDFNQPIPQEYVENLNRCAVAK